MALITRYVNTASSGGDGTTNATSGANAAYASLNAAIDAEATDLVTAGNSMEFLCSGSTADTTAPTFASTWVMDATNYITIKPNTGQEPGYAWNSGVYRLELTVASATVASTLPVTNVFKCVFQQIQFRIQTNSGTSAASVFLGAAGAPVGSRIEFHRCIMRWVQGGTYTGQMRFWRGEDSDWFLIVTNCLVYDFNSSTAAGLYHNSVAHGSWIFNCTFHNCGAPINIGAGTTSVHLRNCLFKSNSDDTIGSFNADSNFNATDLASGLPGANSRHSQTFTFENEAGDDFRITASDGGARDFGEDLSAVGTGQISVDVMGTTRPLGSAWDIGFFEVAASSDVLIQGLHGIHRGVVTQTAARLGGVLEY